MKYKHIFGQYDFIAEGSNTVKFINALKNKKCHFENISTVNNKVTGSTYKKGYKKISEIAENNNMTICVKTKKGLIFNLAPYKKRIGIILGIIFSLVIIFILSNITLKIRITGCTDDKLKEEIISVLELNDIKPGKFIPSMNFKATEYKLVQSLDEISWASIRNSGGEIIVNVCEATPSPERINNRFPCNLVSKYDAQIIDTRVYAGKLIPLIGEGVKKGDILVSGFFQNELGHTFYVHSYGEIIGEYTFDVEFIQKYVDTEKVLTDKSQTLKKFNFFSIKIPISFGDEPDWDYKYDEYSSDFSFFKIKLPFGITNSTYQKYETIVKNYTEKEAENILNDKVFLYEQNFLTKNEIIKKDINKEFNDDCIKYTVTYKVRGNIAEPVEILYKN